MATEKGRAAFPEQQVAFSFGGGGPAGSALRSCSEVYRRFVTRRLWIYLVVAGLFPGSGTAAAQTLGEAAVRVTPGPTSEATFLAECNDAVLVFEESTSFVLERTGETDVALAVAYEVSGSALGGEHYEPLPGTVEFGAGESTATVAVDVLTGERGDLVELRLRIADGDNYQPGVPDEAAIQFVRPRDPSLPPTECGFFFRDGDRIERTVEVGAAPDRVVVEQFAPPSRIELSPGAYRVTHVGGELPPGLSLAGDGRFLGVADQQGTYESSIEACRNESPGTCTTATLVIEVIETTPTTTTVGTTGPASRTAGTLPATGGSPASDVGAGMVLVTLGLILCGARAVHLRRVHSHPRG